MSPGRIVDVGDVNLVLAVAQEAGRDETKPKVVNAVTLEVTPEQAEKIDLARSVGTLSLVLRNQVDPTPSKTSGATKDSLLALKVDHAVEFGLGELQAGRKPVFVLEHTLETLLREVITNRFDERSDAPGGDDGDIGRGVVGDELDDRAQRVEGARQAHEHDG